MATELILDNVNIEQAKNFESDEKQGITNIINALSRRNVEMCISLHNVVETENDNLEFHLVLKFFYKRDTMKYFMDINDIPNENIKFIKKYNEGNNRFFPYVIFNAISEQTINWSYSVDNDDNVYERIELYTTLTYVSFTRYSPFILKLLNIKIGSDGTLQTNLINLIPKSDSESSKPLIDFGIFLKETSTFNIKNTVNINDNDSDVFCKTVIRDLNDLSYGNIDGIYTRVYTCLFFEESWLENLFKYVIISTTLLLLLAFTPDLESDGESLNAAITLILTEVAVFFLYPDDNEFTTTERIIIFHTITMIWLTIFTGLNLFDDIYLLQIILVIIFITCLFVLHEYTRYRRLVKKIRKTFYSNGNTIANFIEIDQII